VFYLRNGNDPLVMKENKDGGLREGTVAM